MDDVKNFTGKSIKHVFEDLDLLEYYPGKITIETAKALARKRINDTKDIPWCFIENVINPTYDGRSTFFLGQNNCDTGSLSGNSDDFDWETDLETEGTELYTFLDVAVAVFLCCDGECKHFLAHMLDKSQLSAPIILPDTSDNSQLIVQSSVLRGITQEVGYETHIPNTLLIDDAHKPFYDKKLELNKMGGASDTQVFIYGLVEGAMSHPHECTCLNGNVCSCTFKKMLLFLNMYGISREHQTQQHLVCEVSTLVTVVVDAGTLAGDSETISNIKHVVDTSQQTLVVFTNEDECAIGVCKQGVEEVRTAITGSSAQVVVLFHRGTGKPDNVDVKRGHMKKKINAIVEMVDTDDVTLKERFENLAVGNVIVEEM